MSREPVVNRKPTLIRRQGKKKGRPAWVPDERARGLIKALAAFGLNIETIAKMIGVAPNTIRRHRKLIALIKRARPTRRMAKINGLAKGIAFGEFEASRYVLKSVGNKFGW